MENHVTLDIKKLAEELSTDGPARHKAKLALQKAVGLVGAKDAEPARKQLAATIANYLADSKKDWGRRIPQAAETLSYGRRELCRYLGEIAGPDEVPALAKLMDDLEVREAARMALGEIPGDAATAELAKIATEADGTVFRLGALASLAKRTGQLATEAFRKCAEDADARVRTAAADALSHGAEPGYDGVIQKALDPAEGSAPHADLNKLRLRLAGNLAKAGHKAEAKKLFEAVAAGPHGPRCKKAVTEGLKALGAG